MVPQHRFKQQVTLLKAVGFTGISLRHWLDARANKALLPRKPIIFTFDDGYAGVYQYALPILKEAGFTATIYVIAEDMVSVTGVTRAFPVLTREQLRQFVAENMEIGAHSFSHRRDSELSEEQRWMETFKSKEILQDVLAMPVTTYAYPYGEYSAASVDCVCQAGYEAAVVVDAVKPELAGSLFTLPRTVLGYDQSIFGFTRRVGAFLKKHSKEQI